MQLPASSITYHHLTIMQPHINGGTSASIMLVKPPPADFQPIQHVAPAVNPSVKDRAQQMTAQEGKMTSDTFSNAINRLW